MTTRAHGEPAQPTGEEAGSRALRTGWRALRVGSGRAGRGCTGESVLRGSCRRRATMSESGARSVVSPGISLVFVARPAAVSWDRVSDTVESPIAGRDPRACAKGLWRPRLAPSRVRTDGPEREVVGQPCAYRECSNLAGTDPLASVEGPGWMPVSTSLKTREKKQNEVGLTSDVAAGTAARTHLWIVRCVAAES